MECWNEEERQRESGVVPATTGGQVQLLERIFFPSLQYSFTPTLQCFHRFAPNAYTMPSSPPITTSPPAIAGEAVSPRPIS